MGLGVSTRLARLFSHDSGRLFGAALDHFVGYGDVRQGGLANLPGALATTMASRPDSVTILPGAAKALWPRYAGQASLIVQGGCFTADDRVHELVATPLDAVRLGADALAVAIPVRGDTEGMYLKWLTDSVSKAAELEVPIVAHLYPRDYSGEVPTIVFTPEEIAWAVRCGIETGVDVIKVGYPGDFDAFREIVDSCPTPIVIAGGPKTATLEEALQQVADANRAGARGAIVGRNMWGAQNPAFAAATYEAVIHQGLEPKEAISQAEMSIRS